MKSTLTALLAICLCWALMGDDVAKKKFEETKAKAEKGDAKAQTNLGEMYAKREGVLEDDKEAVKWYRKAAEQGDAVAQFNLGVMYDNGEGVPEGDVTSYAWFNIAAANGDEDAKKNKGIVAKKMTTEQIAEAEALVKEMLKKNPKLLNIK